MLLSNFNISLFFRIPGMRFFIDISYRGTAYCGWQRQPNGPSVQQAVEEALATLLRVPVEVVGAGRTDAGVHATAYTAHFDCAAEGEKITSQEFLYHLNAILPGDIAAQGIVAVKDEAHARFDAYLRTYNYRISTRKDPFSAGLAWQYTVPLDVAAMNRAAAMMLEYDDFTCFCKLHSGNTTNICRVSEAEWTRDGDSLLFTISADRFLRNMVRAVVGTLVDVGRGKITEEEFRQIIESKDLSRASGSAPAEGLFMAGVEYPDDIYY